VKDILDAILAGDRTPETYAGLPLPESYRGVTVRKEEVERFDGLPSADKDPREALHVDEVAVPELGPGEALVAVMASAVNYNTVWTSISSRSRRSGSSSGTAARRRTRSATTCRTTSSDPTPPASCSASVPV
jgi:hypothetical protein